MWWTLLLISQCRGNECWGLWKPIDEHGTAPRRVQCYHLLPEPGYNSCPGECFRGALMWHQLWAVVIEKWKWSWPCLRSISVQQGSLSNLCLTLPSALLFLLSLIWFLQKTILTHLKWLQRLEIACKSMSPCPVVFSRFKDNKEYLPPEVFLSPSWLNNISISPRDNLVAPRAKAWCPASCSFWRKCYQITTNGDTTLMEWERKLVRMLKGGGERNKRITCLIFSSSHLGFALYISWYC